MTIRQSQINSILVKDISSFIEKIKPSELGVVSISYINTANDISTCRVGLQVYPRDNEKLKRFINQINLKKSRLQLKISRDHGFNKILILAFELDNQVKKYDKINDILNNL